MGAEECGAEMMRGAILPIGPLKTCRANVSTNTSNKLAICHQPIRTSLSKSQQDDPVLELLYHGYYTRIVFSVSFPRTLGPLCDKYVRGELRTKSARPRSPVLSQWVRRVQHSHSSVKSQTAIVTGTILVPTPLKGRELALSWINRPYDQ